MSTHHLGRAITLALALAAVAGGCATQPKQAQAPLPGKATCIFSSTVSSWEVLDDQNLLVQAPLRKDSYLIRLFQPIVGLRFHETLGFEDGDHNGQLCSTGDSLLVRGSTPQRSPIAAVQLLTAPEVRALETKAGIKPDRSSIHAAGEGSAGTAGSGGQ